MGIEVHETVTATELVRNLSVLIDKVRISNRSLYITKGSQTVAELSPPPKSGLPMADLGRLLASLPGLEGDAATFTEDMNTVRAQGQLPESPWD